MLNSLEQKLYTLADVARAAGINYSSVFRQGSLHKDAARAGRDSRPPLLLLRGVLPKIVGECMARKSGAERCKVTL